MRKLVGHVNRVTGYRQHLLYREGKPYARHAHRLVAEAYIPNPNCLSDVNHKDGNKLNNTVSNLEWMTRSQNMFHAYRTGLHPTVQIAAYTKDGKFVRAFNSENEAVEFCRVGYNAGISRCLNGKTQTAHGYVWKYL